MRDITYTVEVGYTADVFRACGGYDIGCNTATAAIDTARAAGKKTNLPIYISFRRASDGQTGYLNPDGRHEIAGKNWNVEHNLGSGR